MNFNNEFKRLMDEQTEIALATCIVNQPNVRIVNYYYNGTTLYFTTFKDNQKVKEFKENSTVAFTTIPHQGNAHIKVQNATVILSTKSIADVADGFIKKNPGFAQIIEFANDSLLLYEISFNSATVTIDYQNIKEITIK